ncbi:MULTISPECIES: manganese efflux pump MntP [Psychrobacter]|nr:MULTISPECIES: manganese efflux pump MntP family protein [Psychrobacter]NYR10770.1 manganese efflux pump [Psychrobacter sp. BI730]MBA6243249.1 manganese efflux pump [Psychrobacter sp. Urea-trap-18]MBA6284916.1 manganese efflux pump [Psychrobacter sp. Urea-trap-16]MBA6317662.1 manganese efflux pump [Psychrobacter sp. Urea-trap-20]MBA6333567.1 manganese efflux pump [Psychrobacter sp. Urea-trap-19]
MNPIALLLLALSMSTDAFSVAISKGASLKNPRFTEAFRMGVIFGTIEAITPIIGWLIGHSATSFIDASFIEAWDHWVAFVILFALGLHMLYEGMKPSDEAAPSRHSFFKLALTAFGTSIDAMAVGVSLAFVKVNILLAAGLIGLATTVMVTLGVMLGKVLGSLIGHRAEVFGGVMLIAIGAWILLSHLQ